MGAEVTNASDREYKSCGRSADPRENKQVIDFIEIKIQLLRERLYTMIAADRYDPDEILKISQELDLLIMQSATWHTDGKSV